MIRFTAKYTTKKLSFMEHTFRRHGVEKANLPQKNKLHFALETEKQALLCFANRKTSRFRLPSRFVDHVRRYKRPWSHHNPCSKTLETLTLKEEMMRRMIEVFTIKCMCDVIQ